MTARKITINVNGKQKDVWINKHYYGQIHSQKPNSEGKYTYTLFWLTDYLPSKPYDKNKVHSTGQVFTTTLPRDKWSKPIEIDMMNDDPYGDHYIDGKIVTGFVEKKHIKNK